MEEKEFNKRIAQLTEDFISNWSDIVNKFAEENTLGPNHKLCVFLFSHLGIEKALANRVWRIGDSYVEAVASLGKELKSDDC